ncbi:MAG: hypothetical protein ACPG85_03615 [Flavobacteriales bacterium]
MEVSERTAALLGSLISLLVTALFIHFGASAVVKGKQRYTQAILVAFLGSLLAFLVLAGAGFGLVGNLLALAAWALVAAAVYRTSWLGGALIGVVAWVLWLVIQWILATTIVANL